MFAVTINGTNSPLAVTHNFAPYNYVTDTNSDGADPYAGLILSGNTLYGTAVNGGDASYGTVFSILLPSPPLTITLSGTNDVLTWPTYNFAILFTLQSTTSLAPPTVWNDVFPLPVVVNGQNTVTNPVSGTQTFYRLSL